LCFVFFFFQERFLLNPKHRRVTTNDSSSSAAGTATSETPAPTTATHNNAELQQEEDDGGVVAGLYNYSWHVPISYTQRTRANFTSANTGAKLWLSVGEQERVLKLSVDEVPRGDWVVLNVRQAGYYRVNYDLENWRRITEQLIHDHTLIGTN
jgi:hypothetical protein